MWRSPRHVPLLHVLLALALLAFVAAPALTAPGRGHGHGRQGSPGGAGDRGDSVPASFIPLQVDDKAEFNCRGAVVDSYQSSVDPDADRPASQVVLGLNSTKSDHLRLKDRVIFNGDAFVGVGGDPAEVIKLYRGAKITGQTAALSTPLRFDATELPQGSPFSDRAEGDLLLRYRANQTINSDRHFRKVEICEGSTLTVHGNVTLYVDREFKVKRRAAVVLTSGSTLRVYAGREVKIEGDLNDGGLPSNVHLYSFTNGQRIKTEREGKLRAVLHSPKGKVELMSRHPFFGLIRAKELKAESRIHVDLDASFTPVQGDASIFREVGGSLGIAVVTTDQIDNASGWHWADLNNDGYLDAVASGTSARRFLNNAGASFSVASLGRARRQGALADFDHDGDVDFWIAVTNGYNDEAWYQNQGDGTLTRIDDAGFYPPSNNEGVATADVDGDGWCDVVMFSANGNYIGHHESADPLAFSPSKSESYGLHASNTYGNGEFCSSADVNADGYLDFFYHYANGRFFLSNGDGAYTWNNRGITAVCGNNDKSGSCWGDYDSDGDMDLFISRLDAGQQGYLWQNVAGNFALANASAGVTDNSIQRGCDWGDCDNDGDLDLLIATSGNGLKLYLNNGDGTFTLDSAPPRATGDCQDACFVDFDNDGDLDIAVTRSADTALLFENSTDGNDYLKVRVVGAGERATNQAGIGVRIELRTADGATLLGQRHVGVARGFAGSAPLWAHFGGVDPTESYLVRVHFLSGVIASTVVPAEVSSTIGGTVVPQMITFTEPAPPPLGSQVTDWTEVDDR